MLERAQARGCSLILSVDCGIRAHPALSWAKTHGLDCIVTDHHLPDPIAGLPPAFAILNPNQEGCKYPDKNLAGVGVAFKLIHALFRACGRERQVRSFLKMVAIGTIADMAPLVGENRSIVALGLADLPHTSNQGLRALMEVAGLGDERQVYASDVAFRIGPRINAAGRMDAARMVVELFEAIDKENAERLARDLDAHNRERRIVQEEIVRCAFEELEAGQNERIAVIAGHGWHRGVIGLAASKITERQGRIMIRMARPVR